jgi:methyltransferase (TIGR00027 family)
MKANTASRTAQYMALYRALETRRPAGRRLFTDIFDIYFLERMYRLLCRLAAIAPVEGWLYRLIQKRIPGALASGLARTRLIDDLLKERLEKGARQVILLGAGFDTRALRLQQLQGVPVIEIDHPDTSGRKLTLLRRRLRI